MIKAVIVGINAYPSAPLSGCVNDVVDVADHLTAALGVLERDIITLVDGTATKHAIVSALHEMIDSSAPGDHLLFHFSGHGTQIESTDPEEADQLDEVLCPVDFRWEDLSSALTDDEVRLVLGTVPPDVTMTVVIDACHSGDYARLAMGVEMRRRFLPPPSWIAHGRSRSARVAAPHAMLPLNTAVASACQPNQVAIDTSFDGRPNGAFTYALLETLRSGRESLVSHIAQASKGVARFAMTPVLEAGPGLADAPFLSGRAGCKAIMGSRTRATSRAMGEEIDLGKAGEIQFAGGLFGASYNQNMFYELPQGYHRERVEVYLDPPGSGNVYAVRFLLSEPTRGSFEYHVGVNAFWGGKATFHMIARPVVTINNPIVRDEPQRPPQTQSAPLSRAAPEELEMEHPIAGGSIRA